MNSKKETRLQGILDVAHHDYEKGMNAYAFFKTSNHQTGEDLVQDTFMKTWNYLVHNGKIDMMKTFLYHVLNNLIVDQYRKHKTSSLDVLLKKGFDPAVEDFKRFFDVIDGKTAVILIKSLPEPYQRIMKMKYIQDLSITEMSLITGQSRNVIAVQAHRGLEKLKILYKGLLGKKSKTGA